MKSLKGLGVCIEGGKHVINKFKKKAIKIFSWNVIFHSVQRKGHLASCSINVPPFMIGFQSFIKTYHAPRHKAMIKKKIFPPQSGHQSFFLALGSLLHSVSLFSI